MRRVRYYTYGDPGVLTVEDAAVPEPGPGQVLIRTEAIGANFVDTRFRSGLGTGPFSRPLPGVLTGDVVGTVAGTDRRVAALAEDAFAEYVVADEQWLAPVPADLAPAAASMLPMGGPVALRVLRTARLEPGETVLVHAAAGGIGHLAVQIARLLGAGTVIGTAGSASKLDFVRRMGADVAVDYSDPDWPDRVRAAVPGGVDVVVDSVGGDVLLHSFDLLAPFGRVVVYGAGSGQFADLPVARVLALRSVAGFSLLAWRRAAPAAARAEMDEIAAWSASGRLQTALHATVPLAEPARAHRILESRANLGRVLLVP
jgi:NADPH:quinone reductase-like Zn-dependent oxidoreductase